MSQKTDFYLPNDFISKYVNLDPKFGFNGLGEIVYERTYSRMKENGIKEQWYETIRRVVEGTYTMQKEWMFENGLVWNEQIAQKSAREMYDRMFKMKFLPPGRGLWAMGSPLTRERKMYATLNNCAFVTTEDIDIELSKPFCFLFEASMLGVGVGFDTKGAGKIKLKQPGDNLITYVIPDKREGWVKSLEYLLNSYFDPEEKNSYEFNYDKIRPVGERLKAFGGVSSGSEPLKELHKILKEILDKNINKHISITLIVDIMNLIGKCVVSGNIRRTAEIAFGESDSKEFMDLKDYNKNGHRITYGWASNNSIFADVGMDYSEVSERIINNGEPGLAWLDNMRRYSRMSEEDFKDHRASGGNPCLEQTLESYELCCLVETFPDRNENLKDFLRTLKFAYLYAKTVTLGKTQWAETNRVLLRNRRIGCSISGIAQFIANNGIDELKKYMEIGYHLIQVYDKTYSNLFAIPKSIKTTSIKPSGTVSLLAGATPGVHFPESRFYIRRVRMSKQSELLVGLKKSNYDIEDDIYDKSSVVVSIPVDAGEGIRTNKDVTMWEKLELAAFAQQYWADNQVSCTVTFDKEKEGKHIKEALNYYQYRLKGISFLPISNNGYKQAPYEEIDEQTYNKMKDNIKKIDFSILKIVNKNPDVEIETDIFCDGVLCNM